MALTSAQPSHNHTQSDPAQHVTVLVDRAASGARNASCGARPGHSASNRAPGRRSSRMRPVLAAGSAFAPVPLAQSSCRVRCSSPHGSAAPRNSRYRSRGTSRRPGPGSLCGTAFTGQQRRARTAGSRITRVHETGPRQEGRVPSRNGFGSDVKAGCRATGRYLPRRPCCGRGRAPRGMPRRRRWPGPLARRTRRGGRRSCPIPVGPPSGTADRRGRL